MQIDAVALRFLQGLIEAPGDKQLSAVARRCSEEFRIGSRVGRRFFYSDKDIAEAVVLLQAHGLPLTNAGKKDRADAADTPGLSEKIGSIPPHNDSVAYRSFRCGAQEFAGYGVATALEVSSTKASVMMVVENLETFRKLHQYNWVVRRMQAIEHCVVVFRGDGIYYTSDAARCVELSTIPKIGFHDFDPAGLAMSASLQGVVEHLLPDQSVLERAIKAGKRSDLYFSQIAQYASVLDRVGNESIAAAWDLMRRLQKGLPQEWMRDL
jgi:hypothetical protein